MKKSTTINFSVNIEDLIKTYIKHNLEQIIKNEFKNVQLTIQPSESSETIIPEIDQNTFLSDMNKVDEQAIEDWKKRSLDSNYSILYIDSISLHLQTNRAKKDSIFFTIGITEDGYREILDFYIINEYNFMVWKNVFQDLYSRGVKKILVGVFNEVTGLTEAFHNVYPQADIQRCFSNKLKKSIKNIDKSDQDKFILDVKRIYQSTTKQNSLRQFDAFRKNWEKTYPSEVLSWKQDLPHLLTFFKYPNPIWPILYNTRWIQQTLKDFRKQFRFIDSPSIETAKQIIFCKTNEFNQRWKQRKLKGFNQVNATLKNKLESGV